MNNIIEKYKEVVGKSKYIAIAIPYVLLVISDLLLVEFVNVDKDITLNAVIIKNTGNIIFAYFLGNIQHKKYKKYIETNKILQSSGN